MEFTEEIYEAAWAKRNTTTAEFKVQLNDNMAAARALQSEKQLEAVIAVADKYDDDCQPAVEEWQRDLGIFEEI